VDIDGDGMSSYSERYVFNQWLALGGRLEVALLKARAASEVIDLSEFFSGSEASLGPESVLAETGSADGGEEGVVLLGGGGSCGGSMAFLAAPFDAAGNPDPVQVCGAFESPSLLSNAFGHTVDAPGRHYVARRRLDPTGGITRVNLQSVLGAGGVPISPTRVTDLVSNLIDATQLAWDPATNDLLVTLANAAQVHRFDLNMTLPQNPCLEVSPVNTSNIFGVDILPSGHPELGLSGDLYLTESRLATLALPDTVFRARTNAVCDPTDTQFLNDAINRDFPQPVAIGSFQGADFGVYVAGATGVIDHVQAVEPIASRLGFALAPISGVATALEFDPFSSKLFVTDSDGPIFRVKQDGSVALFGDFFVNPNGISFHKGGVMLVSEEGRLTVVDGWRFRFRRGDANADGIVNVSDTNWLTNWLFLGGAPAPCWDSADINDDRMINLTDAVFLTNFLFNFGPPPPLPGPFACGVDPTIDLFGCGNYRSGVEPACTVDP
jgi:hypothetical protein